MAYHQDGHFPVQGFQEFIKVGLALGVDTGRADDQEVIWQVARLLGAEPVYQASEGALPENTPNPQLTRNALVDLPEDLRGELQTALTRLDRKRVEALIDDIIKIDSNLEDGLQQLAAEYRYDILLELLRE